MDDLRTPNFPACLSQKIRLAFVVMSEPSFTVREILQQRGGGPARLAKRSEEWARKGKLPKPIAEKPIYSWFGNGIPEKNWAFVMKECTVSEGTLHAANEAVRKAE